jgi:hypothetical protein
MMGKEEHQDCNQDMKKRYEKSQFSDMMRDCHIYSKIIMNAAAPDGTPPRRISDHKFSRYFPTRRTSQRP